ncbi:MAG: hypothetical protein JXA14_12965 [Anaerolineae bacterium]|nr:hypothetical protein [Anaerolineae bacterium]
MAAIPNVTLLEAPWANREAETDVAGGAPVGLIPRSWTGMPCLWRAGIEASGALVDEASGNEELAASKLFVPSLQVPR